METIVIRLGGSVISENGVNVPLVKEFKELVTRYLDRYRFIIVCGGGKICRLINEGARQLGVVSNEEFDRIGIRATMLNAEMIRAVFGELAYKEIVFNYNKTVQFDKVLVCSGWLPGHSSDFGGVMFGKRFKAKTLVHLTDVPYIYDKGPKKFPDAKSFKQLMVANYISIVGSTFSPGMNVPFDPVAAQQAQKALKIVIMSGLKNLEALLSGAAFEGTTLD